MPCRSLAAAVLAMAAVSCRSDVLTCTDPCGAAGDTRCLGDAGCIERS